MEHDKTNYPSKVESILAKRGSVHGPFEAQAALATKLDRILSQNPRFGFLAEAVQHGLDMVCVKLSRIMSGDPHHYDHWRDIQGYLTLMLGHISNNPQRPEMPYERTTINDEFARQVMIARRTIESTALTEYDDVIIHNATSIMVALIEFTFNEELAWLQLACQHAEAGEKYVSRSEPGNPVPAGQGAQNVR